MMSFPEGQRRAQADHAVGYRARHHRERKAGVHFLLRQHVAAAPDLLDHALVAGAAQVFGLDAFGRQILGTQHAEQARQLDDALRLARFFDVRVQERVLKSRSANTSAQVRKACK